MTRFDAELFGELRARAGIGLGAPLSAVAVTDSTNDDALNAARSGASHGATFVADRQTRGRGRRGRSWYAGDGESLLCSVVLRLPLSPEAAIPVSLAIGVGLRAAIARSVDGARVLVKWPNDVWIEQKKVAGVLTESCLQGTELLATVVGFGINVSGREFPEELSRRATSLRLAGSEISREQLLVSALAELEDRTRRLVADGVSALIGELAEFDALQGRRVRVDDRAGVARGIDAHGRLLLETDDGASVAISAGSVELTEAG